MKPSIALAAVALTLALIATSPWTDVSILSIAIGIVAVLAAASMSSRIAGDAGQRLYLIAVIVVGVGLHAMRSFMGIHDLANVPGDFALSPVDYNRAGAIASAAAVLSVLTYALVARRHNAPAGAQRLVRWRQGYDQLVLAVGCGALASTAVLFFALGIGSKNTTSSIPFQGFVVFGLEALIRLTGVALIIAGTAAGNKRLRNQGIAILALDMMLGFLGGARGEFFHFALYVAGALLIAVRRTVSIQRVAAMSLIAIIVAIPLTTASIDRRIEVVGGGAEFEAVDFLALRISGMNRTAPIVAANDLQFGAEAFTNTRSLINTEIYDLNDQIKTGIGAPLVGVAHLGYGLAGSLLAGVGMGAVAAVGDRRLGRRMPFMVAAYHVVAAELYLDAMLQFRFIFNGKELIALTAMALPLVYFSRSRAAPASAIHDAPASTFEALVKSQ